MSKPDTRIHPHATGPAATVVADHQKEQDLVFWSGWFCPYNQRAWVALEEKKVPYQYKEVNPYHKEASFLALNPKGLVPTMEFKGVPLYESNVIVEFLDDAFPETTPLFPSSPTEKALARIQIDYISKKIIPTQMKLVMAQTTEAQDDARKDLVDSLREITRQVKGPFYAGETFGAVDIAIAPFLARLYIVEEHRGFKMAEVGPEFEKWFKACTERESMVKTSSDREHYTEIYARYLSNTAQSEMAKSIRGEKSHA